jgi:hypothetical protein
MLVPLDWSQTSRRFRAASLKKAAASVAAFSIKITEANLKELGKMPGVGKGTLDKV